MTRFFIIILSCAVMLAGCSSTKRKSGGGYYKDDGPGDRIPANIQAIPDAVPRIETHAPANRRPYVVLGKRYVPISDERPFRQVGTASWYGRKFHGKKTANGETYDMYAMTAAHPTLPLPSYARVRNARNGRTIIVRINDRGPFHRSRVIDLSYVAAAKLGLIGPGSGQVIVEAITNADIRNNTYQRGDQPMPKAVPIPNAEPAPTPTLIARSSTATTAAAAPKTAPVARQASPTAAAPSIPEERPLQTMPDGGSSQPVPDVGPSQAVPDALAALAMTTATSPDATAATATASPAKATARASDEPLTIPGVHTMPQPAAKPDASTVIFLQFGAFSTRENASGLASRLNQEIGHIEHRRAEIASSTDLHRVQVGPYSTRTQAVNAALRIQAETGRKATYAIQEAGQNSAQGQSPVSL